jgi:hypothetical protein
MARPGQITIEAIAIATRFPDLDGEEGSSLRRERISRGANRGYGAVAPRLPREVWRDPDSNRGHRDFQGPGVGAENDRYVLQIMGFQIAPSPRRYP